MAETSGRNGRRWNYDVFMNFRGQDLRHQFVSHLVKAFRKKGIHPFKDDKELKPGDSITPSLFRAIENSKIHHVILSKNYASSSWCLDELVHIMQCKERDTGQVVMPIFYDVDPSDVRHLKGSFGEAFDKHKNRYSKKRLKDWEKALKEVANLSGYHWDVNRSEADFVASVTKETFKRLANSYLPLPKYAVGIKSRVRQIHELMRFDLDDVQIIGIWGMSGIGKTTIAKAAFNDFADRFEGASFLENFGGYSKTPDQGKVHFQKLLLSDILKSDDIGSNNMDHALKDRFRNKRVLVVIDNLSDWEQFESLGISSSCFGPGSRILVTCTNKHILTLLETENIYSPEALNDDDSLRLVSLRAFRSSEPPEGFLQLSEKLAKYCAGLPLAIEVLGASLYKRSIYEWENTLERLKQTPHDDIKAKLQISFDSLFRQDKDIFLDISCFFTGMDKDYVSCILDGCKLYPELGLKVLKERCLITVRDNRLMMHDLLRDMGRQIIRETSPQNCERWSRLWDSDNVIDVLANYSGTNAIRGLSLKADDTAVENLEVKAFSNLQKLQLLQLSHVSVNGSYEHFPKDLRWFCWFHFPLASIPTNLHLENVVVMDLKYSNVKRLWDDREAKPPVLEKLKYLDLSYSAQLTDSPDFSYLPNLEKLLLIDCKSLVRVHNSIGTLQQKLALLNLKGCTELGELPLEFYKLKSLETLILSGCSQLSRLDDALGEMKSLKTLKADYTGLTQIPSLIDQLENLEELSLEGCKELWKNREGPQAALPVPLSLNGLRCLKTLSLAYCNLFDDLVPLHIGSLSCLEELDLRGNKFRNLQTDLSGLLSLQILKLDGCSELQSMFSLPKNLRSLYARNCIMLKATPDLSNCSVLQSLHLTNCSNLDATPGLDKLKTVGVIHMEMCNNIPSTYRERLMQGWAVGANGGVFIPGSVLPNWVSFKSKRNSISFTVPENLNLVPDGFTFWTRYVSEQNNVMSNYSPKITVNNQTKRDMWIRNPATDQIRMYTEEHIWQGHFSNEDFCLETGDQVEVSVNFGEQVIIRETGLTLAYRDKVIDTSYEQFPQTEQEVDNELKREENQRTPCSIMNSIFAGDGHEDNSGGGDVQLGQRTKKRSSQSRSVTGNDGAVGYDESLNNDDNGGGGSLPEGHPPLGKNASTEEGGKPPCVKRKREHHLKPSSRYSQSQSAPKSSEGLSLGNDASTEENEKYPTVKRRRVCHFKLFFFPLSKRTRVASACYGQSQFTPKSPKGVKEVLSSRSLPLGEINSKLQKTFLSQLASSRKKRFIVDGHEVKKTFFADIHTPKQRLDNSHMEVLLGLLWRKFGEKLIEKRIAVLDTWFPIILCQDHSRMKWGNQKTTFGWNNMVKNYIRGTIPSRFNKLKWFVDVDVVYTLMIWGKTHWVVLAIHLDDAVIEILDPFASLHTDRMMLRFMKPIVEALPVVIKDICSSYLPASSLPTKFGVFRNIECSQNERAGDCGPLCVKFVELHSHGLDLGGITDDMMDQFRMQYAMNVYEDFVQPISV